MAKYSSRLEHLTLGFLLILAWVGVILQLMLSLVFAGDNAQSITEGFVAYFGYFTVLTNIFVAIIASAQLVAKNSKLCSGNVRGCATTAILLVGIGYHFLLRNVWSPQGWQWVADFILHYAVPLASLLYWALFPPHHRLSLFAPLVWGLYPLTYFVYAIFRGELIGSYPYYFIDVGQLGYTKALTNAVALLGCFIALGFVVRYVAKFRMIRPATARRG